LEDDEFRDGFVADHVRTRLALLIRALREQNGWSQAEFGRRLRKPQSVVSRLEGPDYGRLSLQTLFEVAAAFKLPIYIDMPDWDEWFRLMEDMSSRNLSRRSFDPDHLIATAREQQVAGNSFAPAFSIQEYTNTGALGISALSGVTSNPGLIQSSHHAQQFGKTGSLTISSGSFYQAVYPTGNATFSPSGTITLGANLGQLEEPVQNLLDAQSANTSISVTTPPPTIGQQQTLDERTAA